jgi:hypothetical protein
MIVLGGFVFRESPLLRCGKTNKKDKQQQVQLQVPFDFAQGRLFDSVARKVREQLRSG